MIYLPECVEPLISSIKYFLKPDSGRGVFVNNRIRVDGFQDLVDQLLVDNRLEPLQRMEILKDNDGKVRKFKVILMQSL